MSFDRDRRRLIALGSDPGVDMPGLDPGMISEFLDYIESNLNAQHIDDKSRRVNTRDDIKVKFDKLAGAFFGGDTGRTSHLPPIAPIGAGDLKKGAWRGIPSGHKQFTAGNAPIVSGKPANQRHNDAERVALLAETRVLLQNWYQSLNKSRKRHVRRTIGSRAKFENRPDWSRIHKHEIPVIRVADRGIPSHIQGMATEYVKVPCRDCGIPTIHPSGYCRECHKKYK